jgi:uncharacterized protein (TIGR04141 family)
VPAVPAKFLAESAEARSFLVRIGSAPPRLVAELDLTDILRRTRLQQPGRRGDALRRGDIAMFFDADGQDLIGSARAIKWLEVSLSVGPRRFFLIDGDWYEIDVGYLNTHRATVGRLLSKACSLDLPPWSLGWTEREYNEWVPPCREGFVCLDRRVVRTELHRQGGIEICDLLGPDNELIMVKRAHGSAPLSHLFSQGLVAAQTMLHSPEARRKFADSVLEHGKGRVLPRDFIPEKIVFAILLKHGEALTSDTLFPFSQVTLAYTARALQAQGIDVEVARINALTDRPEEPRRAGRQG